MTATKSLSKRLLVAALVVATAGTLAVGAQARGGHGGWGGHGGGHSMMAGGKGMERMLDGVNATPEQRAQVQRIFEAARNDLKSQADARRDLRQRSMQLFAQPTVDANAVEAVRQQMLQQHDQTSRRMSQAMVEASRVLTPEQRAQLAERMQKRQEMMQRHQRERGALGAPAGR